MCQHGNLFLDSVNFQQAEMERLNLELNSLAEWGNLLFALCESCRYFEKFDKVALRNSSVCVEVFVS